MIRVGDLIVPESRVLRLDCSHLESELRLIVHIEGTQPIELRSAEAVDLVMRVCPSWFEGRRLRWVRHAWAFHNLVGHPALQLLAWAGLVKYGLRVHDLTVPRPQTH